MQNNTPYHRMYENGIDQLFGQKLEQYKMPDDGSDWNAVREKLDNHDRSRKKPVYGKWALGLLLLAGLATSLVYFTNTEKKSSRNPAQHVSTVTPQTGTVAVKDNTVTTYTTAANNNTAPTSNPGENPIKPNQQQSIADNMANDNTEQLKSVKVGDVNKQYTPAYPKNIHTGNNPALYVSKNNGGSHPVFVASKNADGKKGNRPPKQDKSYVSPSFNSEMKESSDIAQQTKAPVTAPETKTATSTPENNAGHNIKSETATPATQPALVQIPEQSSSPSANMPKNEKNGMSDLNTVTAAQSGITPAKGKNKTGKTKTPRVRREAPEHDFSSNQGQWYVEAFSGYNNSVKDNKSFAAFLAPSGYVEKRLNQENALVSLQAGINLKYRKNHFIFGTGLSYLELGDLVKYDASYTGAVALDANGRAKLTYLEIPISAGYDWASKRWGFSIQGGISLGMLMGAKGQYVSVSSFNTGLFDLDANKSIFRKTQLNLLVTPSVNYFINEKTNVFVSPLYRLNLQPVTIPGASINQKYYGMGLRMGIRTSLW
jgi:hypothetical protein